MTSKIALLQSSLAAGELSEELEAREDVEAYFQGAAALRNMIVKVTGGADKRAGFEDIGAVLAPEKRARLIPFIRSRTDRAILEFGDKTLRIIDADTGAPLKKGGVVIVLETPWNEAALDGIYVEQINDVQFITHTARETPPMVLKRYPGNDWRLCPWNLVYGPFLPAAATDEAITPNGQTGTVRLSANAPIFAAGHIGSRFELRTPSGWHSGEIHRENLNVALGQEVVSDGKVYRAEGAGACGGNQPVHEYGVASDGLINWTYLHDGAAIVKITAVDGSTKATGQVEGYIPSLAPTTFWREPAFSDVRGWPAVVFIYEERIGLCGTKAQPDTVHLSAVADYSPESVSFKPGTGFSVVTDADGVSRTLADGQASLILWAVPDARLFIATDGGVKRISGPTLDEPMTPNPGGAVARPVATDGVSSARPAVLQNAILYGSADGGRVMEILMDKDRDEPRDITSRAEHVGFSPIVEFATVKIGDKHVFCRREDGSIYQLTYDRRENVAGFAGWTIGGGGRVESLCVAPDAKKRDQLWAIINWDGNRRICRLARRWKRASDLPDAQAYLDRFEIVDRWNRTQTSVTVFGAEPGDRGKIQASADIFAAGDVGRQFWARSSNPRSEDLKSWAAAQYEIVQFHSSRSVTAKLLTSRPGWSGDTTRNWVFPTETFTLANAAPGERRVIFADGVDRGEVEIGAGGAFSLAMPAARIVAGYVYEAFVDSMPLSGGSPIGSGRGPLKQVESVTVIVRDVVDASVEIVGARKPEPIFRRDRRDLMGVARPPKTGQLTVTPGSAPDDRVQVRIRINGPYAGTVSAVRAKVTTYEEG